MCEGQYSFCELSPSLFIGCFCSCLSLVLLLYPNDRGLEIYKENRFSCLIILVVGASKQHGAGLIGRELGMFTKDHACKTVLFYNKLLSQELTHFTDQYQPVQGQLGSHILVIFHKALPLRLHLLPSSVITLITRMVLHPLCIIVHIRCPMIPMGFFWLE